jgi:hypothetical protein
VVIGIPRRRRDRLLMSRQTFVCRRGTTKPPETYDRGHSQDRRGRPAWRFTQAPPASSGADHVASRNSGVCRRCRLWDHRIPRRASIPPGRHSPVEPPRVASQSRTFAGAAIEIGSLRTGGAHPSIPCMPPGDPHNGTTPLFWAPGAANAEYRILLRPPRNVSSSRARPAISHRLETQRRPDSTLANRPANGSLSADQCRSIGCTSTLRDRDQIEAHRSAAS